jgi:hypothetical protein
MKRFTKMRGWAAALAVTLLMMIARRADAQGASVPGASDACAYRACALSIAPTWNGLMVVRGSDAARVANLNFFLPHDITPALRGDSTMVGADSARAQAVRAVRLRRTAAVLTDLGAVAVIVALARAASAAHVTTNDRVVGGAGLAALLVSVPLQFAADGALSRAVWWHNLRYAR